MGSRPVERKAAGCWASATRLFTDNANRSLGEARVSWDESEWWRRGELNIQGSIENTQVIEKSNAQKPKDAEIERN